MDYAEAKKQILAEKPKDNYMVFKFDTEYSKRLLLPHKDGAALIALLANAEVLEEGYSKPKRITEIERDMVNTWVMSYQEYQRYKIAALLNITPEEVKEHETNGAAQT